MGLLDFLLFGAFMNSLRNNQNNNHSDFSNRSYDQGYEELDREALKQVKAAFSITGQKIKVELINIDMTNIVEDMNEGQNSGEALNCLTWTVKS